MSDAPAYRHPPYHYRHPPYQGGQGGSNLKSIFDLIITSYLILFLSFQKSSRITFYRLLNSHNDR
ncbi:MAG: hypothetical protein EWV70_07150 [Microcystis flos-aquae Mf_QC_C_20070823_S20]|nr:MAG: hypothetical protein EWV70_07150 [Microcystis flos-aquae Mf_QC_C_20070823_S20]